MAAYSQKGITTQAGGKIGGHREEGPHSMYAFIRSAIEKAKTYPLLARKKKIEATVITEFSISNKGYPQDLKITKGSGFEILDSAAMNIISKAAPFPKIDGRIVIPITFTLTDTVTSSPPSQ